MPFLTNLDRAIGAVNYVDSMLQWPAGNRPEDIAQRRAHGLPASDTKPLRAACEAFQESNNLNHGRMAPQDNVDYYRALAKYALAYKVGMCDELAAIAFAWLIDDLKAPCNVTYYTLYKHEKRFHSFLILGEEEVPKAPENHHLIGEGLPPRWPMEAVWCDPWSRDCFEIKDDWHRRVGTIASVCGRSGVLNARYCAFSAAPHGPPSACLDGKINVPDSDGATP